MRRWIWIAALQIVALAVIAQRFSFDHTLHLPWNAKKEQCGLFQASEYVITSRKVVLPSGVLPAAVHVRNGQIAGVAEFHGLAGHANLTQAAALKFGLRRILDYGDLVVSPGLIDTHVHLNEPGREHWEGFLSGTKAAAAGGTTTAILMPLNSLPAIVNGDLLKAKIAATQEKLWIDVGFWGGLIPENAHNYSILQGLLDAGALGFKSFMSPSGIVDFGTVNETHVKQALPFLKSAGVPFYVHAEKVDDTEFKGPVTSHEAWTNSRPPKFEELAIRALRDILLADKGELQPGFKLHIAHLSSATGISIIEEARQQGLPISVETCPHYLNFVSEEVPDGNTLFKCAPPIRHAGNRDHLWAALKQGKINTIASDHSPSPPDMRLLETGDFKNSWGGIAGLQYNLPATWTGMKARGLGPEFLAKVWSEQPAKMANLDGRKGSIRVGLDADFVVWDPDQDADTSRGALLQKHKETPYQDKSLAGRVVATYVEGQQVFSQGQMSLQPCGRTILRSDIQPAR